MNVTLNNSSVDSPEHWRLEMMLSADSLDVFALRQVGENKVISAHLPLDPAAASRAAAFEEAAYSNPMLLMPFGKVDFVVNGGFTLVSPSDVQIEDINALFPAQDDSVTLSTAIDARDQLIFRLDRATYNFLQRTFDNARLTHSLAVLAQYFSRQSRLGNNSKMFVDIEERTMNVLVFNQFGLAMASCFDCPDINDAAYYALASANTAGLDFTNDEIRVVGTSDRRAALMPILRKFARNVMPAIFPASAFSNDSAMSAPFTLAILPLCE